LIGETQALLKEEPIEKIQERQNVAHQNRRGKAITKMTDRGVEWLGDFGGISFDTAAALIAKFFEHPKALPQS
jgi:hypothetical protein